MNTITALLTLTFLAQPVADSAGALAIKQQLIDHAISPEEGSQHVQLALSLRNQKLLEQQAESLARQYQFRLQAAQAATALKNLDSTPLEEKPKTDHLGRYQLRALVIHEGNFEARLSDGKQLITVRNNQQLANNIHVAVRDGYVVLSHENTSRRLEMAY